MARARRAVTAGKGPRVRTSRVTDSGLRPVGLSGVGVGVEEHLAGQAAAGLLGQRLTLDGPFRP
ncbi:hypothetical protein GCM10027162_04950 [Streptomyces incanus]